MDDLISDVRYVFNEKVDVMETKSKHSTGQLKSLTQRLQALFHDGDLVDVTFLVGERQAEFGAHKVILASVSPVFRSMLYGELFDSKEPITITDLSETAFQNVLRYAYDETLHFDTVDECLETLIAADKYLFQALIDVCVVFLRQRVNKNNVLPILDCATFLSLNSLIQPCHDVLDLHIDELIASRALRSIDRRLWAVILSRDKLPCREVELFRELHVWAQCMCSEQSGGQSQIEEERRVIGDLISMVRLSNMSVQQLIEVVQPSGLLPVESVLAAILESSRTDQPCRRRGVDEIPYHLQDNQQTDLVLFYHTSHVTRRCPAEEQLYGCLDFRVNAKLLLRGFQLFGPKKAVLLNAKGDLQANLACTIYCSGTGEWAMRLVDDEAILKPCSPLMNTYNYTFPSRDAALIYPNEWYRVTLSLGSSSYRTPISMCSEPVTRCADINVTFIFRKPGSWRKATAGDRVPYCKFLAGLHYQILSCES